MAYFRPVAINNMRPDALVRFTMVLLWPITKPAHLVEDVTIFAEVSGEDAEDNLFSVDVVLRHVYIVASRQEAT